LAGGSVGIEKGGIHIVVVALMLLCGPLLGCGGGENSEPNSFERKVYVGALQGSNAMVAMVWENEKVSLYVCGHESSLKLYTRWYHGNMSSTADSFSLLGGEWGSQGTVVGDSVNGSLQAPMGSEHPFILKAVAAGTISNLYSVIDSGCRTGVIVAQSLDGADTIVQGAWCNDTGMVKQVTPMTPIALGENGLGVTVLTDDGHKELFVQAHHIAP